MATAEQLPDVVYVVKASEDNEPLRYSLRSLSHVPHRRVWIAGYRPSWVSDRVGHISVPQRGTKWWNSTRNLLAACRHPDVTPDFIYMNDDFFILQQIDAVPVLNRGLQATVLANTAGSRYRRGGYATAELMRRLGLAEPFVSYELHMPIVVNKIRMAEALRLGAKHKVHPLHKRTLYGNLHDIGGQAAADCKVTDLSGLPAYGPFCSTSPDSFAKGAVGRAIRRAFPKRCDYERHQPSPLSAGDAPGKPPSVAADRSAWVEWAVVCGADRRDAKRQTKSRLIELYARRRT